MLKSELPSWNGGAVVLVAVLVLILVWTVINPLSVWRVFQSWKFKEGSEPTDFVLRWWRVGAILQLLVIAFLGFVLWQIDQEEDRAKAAEGQFKRDWPHATSLCVTHAENLADAEGRIEGAVPIDGYLPVVPEKKQPAYLWDREPSTCIQGVSTDLPLSTSDLLIAVGTFCDITNIEVVEDARKVRVQVKTMTWAAKSSETPEYIGSFCGSDPEDDSRSRSITFALVELERPVGDREVIDAATGKSIPRPG